MIRIYKKTVCFITLMAVFVCAILYYISNPAVLAANDDLQSFPILMYHHISPNPKRIGDYVVSPNQFEQDLKYLKDNGYKSITVRDLIAINNHEKSLPQKSVMITFDDGQESFFSYALPLLKKYNMSAVLSIIGKYTEQFSEVEDHNLSYAHVTWDEMKEMQQSGLVEFGNHTYQFHSNNTAGRSGVTRKKGESLEDYKKAVTDDINMFNDVFKKNMGYVPYIYTYPYGRFSKETEQIIKDNGFKIAFTCYEKRVVPFSSDNWLFRLGRYNRSGKITTESYFKKFL